MRLGPGVVGAKLGSINVIITERDAALYALGIGAGQDDPTRDLQFTTENTLDSPQAIYPTYAVLLGSRASVKPLLGLLSDSVSAETMLHAGQQFEQIAPLPLMTPLLSEARIAAVWDKGTSSVIETVASIREADTGRVLARTGQTLFFRGVGGWGGERGTSQTGGGPDSREPDGRLRISTRPDQALLYRLSGDTNPLHTDPAVAARAGFDRPILQGLCVYGIIGRVLLSEYLGSDPTRFSGLDCRFSKPVVPGESFEILVWEGDDVLHFVAQNLSGEPIALAGRLDSRRS